MNKLNNKWVRAAIPALLIHCSIGTVYCWSTFKEAIATKIGMSTFAVGWAFSLAIFFLGMSAAFAGKMVEKNIHKSSLISCLCFTAGMIGTGLFIQFTTGLVALLGIFLCYGCIMGIGLGIGYLTPVKTLMLWFSDRKGLATGISIMGFGLAKAIATPIMEFIQGALGIEQMFYILGGVYFVFMLLGHFLLRKPEGWVENEEGNKDFKPLSMFKDPVFLGIWLMFFINIHCGLALITYEKQILQVAFKGAAYLLAVVSIVPSVTAAFNALGRIGYSSLSDKMKERNTVYKIIFSSCILVTAMALVTFAITNGSKSVIYGVLVILLLSVVNLGYGGGFSTLPALLSERFGMKKISKIHGLALSAWAFAGLTGNNMSELILNMTNRNYDYILIATLTFYVIAMVICVKMVKNKNSRRKQIGESKQTKALYEATEYKNIKEIIYHSAEEYADNIAFVIKHKVGKNVNYTNITYQKLLENINGFGTGLFSLNLQKKRVAIIGKNRYEWILTYLTNLLGGIISVPLDKDLQLDELENSLMRSKADAIVFDEKHKELVEAIKKNNKTNLKEFICMDEIEGYKTVASVMEKGKALIAEGDTEYMNYEIENDIMNILLFTSGTTSKSKAVMLSQRNIASNVYALQCVEDIRPTDTNIAFLPFHHIFGSTCMIWTLGQGLRNVFPDGLRYIKDNLNEYKVTIFVGVPILVESIYKAIMKEVDKQGKTRLIKIATKVSNFLLKFHIDIRRKLFKQILDALGGELRFVVSGGAPADPKYSKGFTDLGIRTVQGYGLTETSPVIAGEDEKHIKFGTVGLPMINDTIEIVNQDENGIGEIRVKGPNVMLGYYEMPEKTAEVLKDGWFYTGDLGYFDKDGYLVLAGRSKDMIVLKNGKKVFPEEIETLVNRLDIVKECMVYGKPDDKDETRIVLTIKVVYDQDVAKAKYPGKTEEEVYQIIWDEMKTINQTFPRYKHIQNMILTKDELIKTTTNKIKRQENI